MVARPFALALLVGLAAQSASAFPIFARKYEVSCATCHVAIPKLNPFGQAFRNQGYQWPGGELSKVKDAPMTLSPPSNRAEFPHALWPSWFPHTVPVAFLMDNQFSWDAASPGPSSEALGTSLELAVGGAVAEDLAARADVTLEADSTGKVDVGIEQLFMQVHNIDLHDILDMRFGKLMPELFSFAPQALGGDYWLYARPTASEWTLAGRKGIELRTTFLSGRARAIAGTSGSEGAFGTSYDGWARLGYKIGGLRYDGLSDDGEEKPGGPKDASRPWRDGAGSVAFGVFAYKGFVRTPTGAPDDFLHLGGDVSIWLGNANLVAAYLVGPSLRRALVQLDYVIWPWLIPSVRYESSSDYDPRWHLLAGVSGLTRVNIRIYLFGELAPDASGTAAFSKATLGVLTAF